MSVSSPLLRHTYRPVGESALDYEPIGKALQRHIGAAQTLQSPHKFGILKFLQAIIYLLGEAVKFIFCLSDWQKATDVLKERFVAVREQGLAISPKTAPALESLALAFDLCCEKSLTNHQIERVSKLMSTYLGVETLPASSLRSSPLTLLDPSLYYEAAFRSGSVSVNLAGVHPDLNLFINGRSPTLPRLLRFWCLHVPLFRGKEDELIRHLSLDQRQRQMLAAFLQTLTKTKDFQIGKRIPMATSLLKILQAAGQNPDLKEALFGHIEEAMSTCGDRLTWAFAWIECLGGFYIASTLQEKLEIVRGLCLVELIQGFCEEKLQRLYAAGLQREETDEIGVVVNCIYRLKERLALPVTLTSILFLPDSAIAEDDLASICSQVLQKVENVPSFARRLAEHPLWRGYLNKEYRTYLQSITEPFYQDLEKLEARKADMTEQQYLFAMNSMHHQRERALDIAYLSLTLPLVVEEDALPAAIFYVYRLKEVQRYADEALMEAFLKGIILNDRAVHSYYRKRFSSVLQGELKAQSVESGATDYTLNDETVIHYGRRILEKTSLDKAADILVENPLWCAFIGGHVDNVSDIRAATDLIILAGEVAAVLRS